jgi:uncharacterized OsmC-like protein
MKSTSPPILPPSPIKIGLAAAGACLTLAVGAAAYYYRRQNPKSEAKQNL